MVPTGTPNVTGYARRFGGRTAGRLWSGRNLSGMLHVLPATPRRKEPIMWGVTRERDAAFTQFAADASASLTSTAWLVSGDREVARDLVQTALLKTYVAWPRVRQAGARAFARRALVNAHIDQWRQRHGEVVSTSTVESRTAASENSSIVTSPKGVFVLPPSSRAVCRGSRAPPRRRIWWCWCLPVGW